MTSNSRRPISADRRTLEAVAGALRREVDFIAKRPDALWQQLYNQLQWDPEPVSHLLAAELQHRTQTNSRPWMWLRTPSAESSALIRIMRGSGGSPLAACVLHPDSNLIIVCDTSQEVWIWDVNTGQLLATYHLSGLAPTITACALSVDGSRMVVAALDGQVVVCDTLTGLNLLTLQERTRVAGRETPNFACAFSPDDTLIAIGGIGGVQIWETATGLQRRDLEMHVTSRCDGLAFSPDGTGLVVAGEQTLSLWNVRPTVLRWTAEATRYAGDFLCCAFSSDGACIATGGRDRASRFDETLSIHRHALRLWDVASGSEISLVDDFAGTITSCTFSPDGTLLATCGEEPDVTLWDGSTGQRIARLEGHGQNVFGCAFSKAGDRVISVGGDSVRIWHIGRALTSSQRVDRQQAGKSLAVEWSSDGQRALSSRGDGVATLWDMPTMREQATYMQPPNLYAHNAGFHPDGRRMALVAASKVVEVRETQTGSLLGTVGDAEFQSAMCAWSLDGRLLLSAGTTDVYLWDSRSLRLNRVLRGDPKEEITAFAISPDGARVLVANEQMLYLWSIDGEPPAIPVKGDFAFNIRDCAFLPDGRTVAAANGHAIYLWDIATKAQRGEPLPYMYDNFTRPAWAISPDGVYMAAAGKAVRTAEGLRPPVSVWKSQTGQHVANLFGHEHFLSVCAFSPDGSMIISGSKDRTVKVWHLETGQEVATLPLPDTPLSLALHPWRPSILVGGSGGHVYHVEVVGISYGPLVVTAIESGGSLSARCPVCRHSLALAPIQIGSVIDCPRVECMARLRVTPFMIPASPA